MGITVGSLLLHPGARQLRHVGVVRLHDLLSPLVWSIAV